MEKIYNFKEFEKKISDLWCSQKIFTSEHSQPDTNKPPFVVVIPPPNVTGVLHMGHGLNSTIQDTLIRYKRMCGYPTLWIPGCDHAGIATQQVMERTLTKQSITKYDIGREEFVKKTYELATHHKSAITQQLNRLGASCDWSRERFTLDEGLSRAVRDVFVTLYERGLIYRGDYLVNWSVGAGTALSDDEVEYKEVKGTLYHIRYPFADTSIGRDGIIVATTRPETMLGDVAVAVHPNDARYASFVGKDLILPLTNKKIPIITDDYVKSEFGSGAVKITPAHDPNDYKVGNRHNLTPVSIFSKKGMLNELVPKRYRGMSIQDARKQVVDDLREQGFLIKEESHVHQVGHCYRTGTIIEPLISAQWFVKMDGMAQKALVAWKEKKITFYPKHWENTFVHWLSNIKDWCISRQLWWGHRIPAWYNDATGEVIVSRDTPANSTELRQETDVLDTWFSSWLWPFSVFYWPEHTNDFKTFYPTSTLVTAYDIIFFWVSRMIMAGLEFTQQVPFKDIYIHGLIRDDKGRKMSKSLGNGIDPNQVIDKYGADAFRFTLDFLCKLGTDILISEDSFHLGSKFANKIWNASRFLLLNLSEIDCSHIRIIPENLTSIDKWMFSRLNSAARRIEEAMAAYRIDDAARIVYEYFWWDFCDWYIETTKVSLYSEDIDEKQRASGILMYILEENLKLLHPFLPFITEEIYRHIQIFKDKNSQEKEQGKRNIKILAVQEYPCYLPKNIYEKESVLFMKLQEVVTEIRTLRSEFNISPKTRIQCELRIPEQFLEDYFKEQKQLIAFLVGAQSIDIKFFQGKDIFACLSSNAIGVEGGGCVAFVNVKQLIDVKKELERLEKKIKKEQKQLEKMRAQLENTQFIKNASKLYIETLKERYDSFVMRVKKLQVFSENLKK